MSAILGLVLLSLQAAPLETPLTVMTFNVRHGTASDGDNAWPHRKPLVAEVLRQYEPDVVGTQECLEFQAQYLCEQLPQYRWLGTGREADGAGEHMAVLYKHQVLAPIGMGNFWLSEHPEVPGSRSWDAACARMVTWVTFYHKLTRQTFHVINTHFDHVSERARRESARALVAHIEGLGNDAPVLLLGDFNAEAGDSEPWRILHEAELRDTWEVATTRSGPRGTFHGFAPAAPSKSRIDWIMTRGPVNVRTCETVSFNREGRFPSDHFPVLAQLVLTGPPESSQ